MTRTLPTLIGAGQIVDRPADPEVGKEPLRLMEDATHSAADDAGGGGALLAQLDTVAVVTNVFHDYGDTATMLAERLGAHPRRALVTTWGGNTPQSLLSYLCDEIAAGRIELALLAGGEAFQTMRALGKAGKPSTWTPPREAVTPRWGDLRQGTSDLEAKHGAREAYVTYALVENAFRASRGQSIDDERRELGEFGARCARVAAANPYAWFRDGKNAMTIATVAPDNRMVAFPFPKYMNAIMEVNQGAALLLASEAAADRCGLPRDRRVYPWAGTDVTELWYLTERVDYHTLPGMRRAARELLETTGVGLDRVRHLDLYSCFPIASRLSAAMLGLAPDDARELTVTGGLPWFGGPGNNYTTHAIAGIVERLRADREGLGFVHALGWNFTKHALGIYGGTPPSGGWRRTGGEPLQQWVDALPHPELVNAASGRGTIEAYTVVHGRDGGPERGVAIGRLDDDRRFIAVLPTDRDVLESLERDEGVGRTGAVRHDDARNVFDPA